MKLWHFGVVALSALAIGIGAAEVQTRVNSPRDETSADAKMVAEFVTSISRDRFDVIKEIRADCTFRFPEKFRVIELCVEDGAAAFDQMKSISRKKNDTMSLGATMLCMKESRSLNGFDWEAVSRCYVRTMVAIKS